jgi:hypothetical protein
MMHIALLRSPLRVHSLEHADVVYVPLYSRLVMFGDEGDPSNFIGKALLDEFEAEAAQLLPALGQKPHFFTHTGKHASMCKTSLMRAKVTTSAAGCGMISMHGDDGYSNGFSTPH